MKRIAAHLLAVTFAAVLGPSAVSVTAGEVEAPVLARVEVAGPLTAFPLPVHARLRDKAGLEYLLVFATPLQLSRVGWPHLVVTSGRPEEYVLAGERRPGARTAAQGKFAVVHDDGRNWLVHSPGKEAQPLSALGFALQRLPCKPMVRTRPAAKAAARAGPAPMPRSGLPDPLVAEMIGRVSTNHLVGLVRRLTGADGAVAGGDLYPILTRNTDSDMPIQKATQFCYEHLQALRLDVSYQDWDDDFDSGRNVVATLPGTVSPDEIVVIMAHLDNEPDDGTAPGADDNASGSATVLMAAEIFRQYRFERTVRFLLVTGEEQGLLGSFAYAEAAADAGDNIVAVLNFDMIAWDGNDDGQAELHTRTPDDDGYADDMAIAETFTNVVALYGLSTSLQPSIIDDGEWASDHFSFWWYGYPAILAIEDYANDFNPYYHLADDALDKINWPYYARYLKAAIGTLAHLASPTGRVPLDIVEVASSADTPGNGIGAAVFYAKHEPGASESGADPFDSAWADQPANTNAQWLKIYTKPYGTGLATDSRPADSETIFFGNLSAVITNGATLACTNRLRFDFLTPPPSNRVFLARVHVDGQYTATSNAFNCVTNIRTLADAGGFLVLPPLAGVSNGIVYGTCEIASRFLDMEPTNCTISIVSAGGT